MKLKKLTGYDKAEFLEKKSFILTLFTLKIMIEWFMSL
jgi:hypothetical protein